MKKLVSLLLALMLVFAISSVAMADPDMSGDVINVTAADAQDLLDGKFGNIDGKTINFTEDIDVILDLARPTKYAGSGTEYVCKDGNSHSGVIKTFTDAAEFKDHFGAGEWHTSPDYYRTLDGVTFTADEGVTVAGFSFNAGHVYQDDWDYVREQAVTSSNNGYYKFSSLKDITFDGLTITGCIDFMLYLEGATVSGITVENCEFTGTTDTGLAAVRMLADSQYFTNVTVKNNEISDYFQGVYVAGVDGITVSGNAIENTTHNAIAMQSGSNPVKGTVTVEENYISGAGDRAIRFNYVDDADIKINDNIMVNSGKSNGELIAASGTTNESNIDLENNYWDGEDVATAIGSGVVEPITTGVTKGNFPVSEDEMETYAADGVKFELGADGNVYVGESMDDMPVIEKPAPKRYAVEVAKTENGDVTVKGSASYDSGVVITAAPHYGYEVGTVTVTKADGTKLDVTERADGTYSFSMPRGEVTIKVTFVPQGEAVKMVLTIGSKAVDVNGKAVASDVAPVIKASRTFLPVRLIAENLGAKVEWNNDAQTVTITKGDTVIVLTVGSTTVLVNGQPAELEAPVFIENSRTYLPVRFIAEKLGADVEWDGATNEVTIIGRK